MILRLPIRSARVPNSTAVTHSASAAIITRSAPAKLVSASGARIDKIARLHGENGYGAGLLMHCRYGRMWTGENDIGCQRDKLGSRGACAVGIGDGPANLDSGVAAFCPPCLRDAVHERREPGLRFRIAVPEPISTPIRRTRSGCCAIAASGKAATAPPRSVMKSRRFIGRNCIGYPAGQPPCIIVTSKRRVSLQSRSTSWLPNRRVYDHKDVQERIVRRSKLDWVIVRPVILTNGPKTNAYRAWSIRASGDAGSSRAPTWRISPSSRSTSIRRRCSRPDAPAFLARTECSSIKQIGASSSRCSAAPRWHGRTALRNGWKDDYRG
jgi:NAD(P)H-binding